MAKLSVFLVCVAVIYIASFPAIAENVEGLRGVIQNSNTIGLYPFPTERPIELNFSEWWNVSGSTDAPLTLLTGDINGDGKLEVVTGQKDTLRVYSANGTLLWQKYVPGVVTYYGRGNLYVNLLEDVNDDGKLEIFCSRKTSTYEGIIYVYDWQGNLLKNFTRSVANDGSIKARAVIEENGRKYVLVSIESAYGANPRGVALFDYETGQQVWYYAAGCDFPLTMDDLDNDGVDEISSYWYTVNNGAWGCGTGSNTCTNDHYTYILVIDVNGNEELTMLTPDPSPDDGNSYTYITDLDNDGTKELLVLHTHSSTYYPGDEYLQILDKNGSNVLRSYNMGQGDSYWAAGVMVGDVDNDGYDEIIVAHDHSKLMLFDHNLNLLGQLYGYDWGMLNDINGDGKLEILSRNYVKNKVSILSWDGSKFKELWNTSGTAIFPSDLDNDGINELIVRDGLYSFKVLKVSQITSPQITVHIDDLTMNVGESMNVSLKLLDSTGVGSVQVTIYFNASIINITSATASDFNDIFTPDFSDISKGILRITCMELGRDLTGDLIIANLTIEALAEGISHLNLTAELSTSTGSVVDFSVRNGSVDVKGTITMPPVASFTFSPQSPRVGESITFDATRSYDPDGSIVSYLWNFGDGNSETSSQPVVSHTYTNSGNYTVTLRVTDNDNISTTKSILVRIAPSQPILWKDNFDNYTTLPTWNYDFKYGTFMLVNISNDNKAIYQDKSYTGENYAMIPKSLVIESKNYEISFRCRPDTWSGIHLAISNSSTTWTDYYRSGNEQVGFVANGYSSSYPPFVSGWARGYTPNYPSPPTPIQGEIPDSLYSLYGGVIRYTGDIGSYADWRWIKVVSNESNLSIYYGGTGETPNWNYMFSLPHGEGNENPPYFIAFYWGNEQGYIDDITVVSKEVVQTFINCTDLGSDGKLDGTITVDKLGNCPTIQWAIDNATAGDTIIVRDGVYYEHVTINKQLTLKSENGPSSTIIDGGGTGTVVTVNANGVRIEGIGVRNSGYEIGDSGIRVLANNVTIQDCEVRSSRVKIGLDGDNNVVHDCLLIGDYSQCNFGIVISGVGNIVYNNTITENLGSGVILDSYYKETYNNLVYSNNITRNGRGIALYNMAHDNIIVKNLISNNRNYGFLIPSKFGPIVYGPLAYHNYIYLNDIIGNWIDVYSENTTNYWHSPQPMNYVYNGNTLTNYLGNYWDKYLGTDANEDGIGDTPYRPDENITDYYPLIEPSWSFSVEVSPNHPPSISLLSPSNGQTFSSTTSVTLQWTASDPDGDSITYDLYFGTSSSPHLYASDLTSTSYTVQVSAGNTYYWKVVAKDGKDTTATAVWSFSVAQPSQITLTVNVFNVNGKPLPAAGGNIRVEIWNGSKVASDTKSFGGGESSISFSFNLEEGNYEIRVYQLPPYAYLGEEYWGKMDVNLNSDESVNFVRNMPVIKSLPYLGTIELNQSVTPTIEVENPNTLPLYVYPTLTIDKDQNIPFDYYDTGVSTSVSDHESFILKSFEPDEAGTYYAYVKLKTYVSEFNGYVVTDQLPWSEYLRVIMCINVCGAFVDVELYNGGQLVEKNTSNLKGSVCFHNPGDTINVLGGSHSVSEYQCSYSGKAIIEYYVYDGINIHSFSPLLKVTRESDKLTMEGVANPLFLPKTNEIFTIEIRPSPNIDLIPIKFRIDPNFSAIMSLNKLPMNKISVLLLEKKFSYPEETISFTDFEPFLYTPRVSNFRIEISPNGTCAGMVISSILNYGYLESYEHDGKFYKMPLKYHYLREHNPQFILDCDKNRCGYRDDSGNIVLEPNYNIAPLDDVYLSMILHQNEQQDMKQPLQSLDDALNEIARGNPVYIAISWKNKSCSDGICRHAVLGFGYVNNGGDVYFAVYNPSYPQSYEWIDYSHKRELSPWSVQVLEEIKFYKIKTLQYGIFRKILSKVGFDSLKEMKKFLTNYKLYESDHKIQISGSGYYGSFPDEKTFESNIPYSAGFMEYSKLGSSVDPIYFVAYPSALSNVQVKAQSPPKTLDPLTVMVFGENKTKRIALTSAENLTVGDEGNYFIFNSKDWMAIERDTFDFDNESVISHTVNVTGSNITVILDNETIKADIDGDGNIDKNLIPPVINFTISGNPVANETVTFDASSSYDPDGLIVNYTWNFGDGNVTMANQLIITHVYLYSGNYTVTLKVTDNNGFTSSLSKLIIIAVKGDFNGNGRIDIGDVARVAYMIVRKTQQDLRADFNNNGRVDIGDLAKIAYYLLGKINEL